MRVVTTSLGIRFYKADGWTLEQLLELIHLDSVVNPRLKTLFLHFKDINNPYWIPNVGLKLDMDRLMKQVTSVNRIFNDYPEQTDREHLESKLS